MAQIQNRKALKSKQVSAFSFIENLPNLRVTSHGIWELLNNPYHQDELKWVPFKKSNPLALLGWSWWSPAPQFKQICIHRGAIKRPPNTLWKNTQTNEESCDPCSLFGGRGLQCVTCPYFQESTPKLLTELGGKIWHKLCLLSTTTFLRHILHLHAETLGVNVVKHQQNKIQTLKSIWGQRGSTVDKIFASFAVDPGSISEPAKSWSHNQEKPERCQEGCQNNNNNNNKSI